MLVILGTKITLLVLYSKKTALNTVKCIRLGEPFLCILTVWVMFAVVIMPFQVFRVQSYGVFLGLPKF